MNSTNGKVSRFQPGQSGNPGGRPRMDPEFVRLMRGHTVEVGNRLLEILRSGRDRDALDAAKIILERAYGRTPWITDSAMSYATPTEELVEASIGLLQTHRPEIFKDGNDDSNKAT